MEPSTDQTSEDAERDGAAKADGASDGVSRTQAVSEEMAAADVGEIRPGEAVVIEGGRLGDRFRPALLTAVAVYGLILAALVVTPEPDATWSGGQELAAIGHLVPSRLLTVRLAMLDSAPRALKNRSRVRCHVGTAEIISTLVLLEGDRLEPGQTGFVQLYLAEPAVTVWGQPLVLRSESPVVTLGGGQVLNPQATRLARNDAAILERLKDLAGTDPVERASAAAYFASLRDWRPDELARTAGVDDVARVGQELTSRGDIVSLPLSASRTLQVHRQALSDIFARIEAALDKEHAQFPLKMALDRSRLIHRFEYLGESALVEAVLGAMSKAGRLKVSPRGVALPGRGPQLSQNEQKLLAHIVSTLQAAGLETPTVDEVKLQAPRNQAVVPQLISLAVADGVLVEVGPGYYLHAETEAQLRGTMAKHLANGGMTVSQIREVLGTTRKYAIPVCEYLDRIGFTRREGDLRLLAQQPQLSNK